LSRKVTWQESWAWFSGSNLLLISLFLITPWLLEAQDLTKLEDSWVLYEKGLYLVEQGEWGEALHSFKLAIAKRGEESNKAQAKLDNDIKTNTATAQPGPTGIFPEAEMAIGDVLKHSEPELAQQQYAQALQHAGFFYVKEDVYRLLYRQVDLFKNYFHPPLYNEMKERLFVILKEGYTLLPKGLDPYYQSQFVRFEETYLKTFIQKGLNKLLFLYRLDRQEMLLAHGELANLYYREGGENLVPAIKHYLFCITILLTEGIEELLESDYTFQFTDLASFFKRVENLDSFQNYFQKEALFKYLYRLAATTYAASQLTRPSGGSPLRGWDAAMQKLAEQRAKEVWQWLTELKTAGKYAELAKLQLQIPWIEPAFTTDY
jgi:hypothetical protein